MESAGSTRELRRGIAELRRHLSSSSSPSASTSSSPQLAPASSPSPSLTSPPRTRFLPASTAHPQTREPPIILDIGARGIRAGIAGASAPTCHVPLIPDARGRIPESRHAMWDLDLRGTRDSDLHNVLLVLLREVYDNRLLLDGKTRKVVVLENPLMSVVIKQAIAFVLFNYFQAISVTFMLSPVCTTIASGSRTALVIDIGWHETTITPIFEFKPMRPSIRSTTRAARHLHFLVSAALTSATSEMPSFHTVEDFLIRACYCSRSSSSARPSSASPQQAFAVTIAGVTHYVPSLATRHDPVLQCFVTRAADGVDDSESLPVPDLVIEVLAGLQIDTRAKLLSRIVFTGACANIPGLKLRIIDEIKAALIPGTTTMVETTNLQKNFTPWKMMASDAGAKITAISTLGSWSGASIYLSCERDYLLDTASMVARRRTGGVATTTSDAVMTRVRDGGKQLQQYSHSSTYRIPGEIERDRFLLDPVYARNIFDWTYMRDAP
ncbi:actin-domain-containing protein [Limtongia smithiae]|uniref:actin-domain-containing protein n=1 Tax=Limtongia smithiae TaxID=1125753 RepID=UPI0034CD968C